jgi:hypothetical protein
MPADGVIHPILVDITRTAVNCRIVDRDHANGI